MEFRLLADTRCIVGEGPVWDDRRRVLWFVDILAPAVHRIALDGSGFASWPMPKPVGSIGLGESGRLIAALRDEFAILDPDSGALTPFATLPADEPATNRLNDGKVGPDGAFWVGSMDNRPEKEKVGNLYRVGGDGSVERKATGYGVSNGLAFSPDGRTMFHSDSRGPIIDRWRFDPATGAIADRTTIATLDLSVGRCDGAACDAEGFYWSAGVFGGYVNRFAPDGRLVESHRFPVPTPTMPCFCGPDLRTLVVTSLRERDLAAIDKFPTMGSLFVAASPVAGTPVHRMRGI